MKLFSPIQIGNLTLKNRIMLASMENGYAMPGGVITERLIRFFEERAQNETAMIITGSMAVDFDGKGVLTQLEIHDPQRLPGIKQMVDRVHAKNALIGTQLYHAGRQLVSDQGITAIAPSALQCKLLEGSEPREMQAEDFARLRESFALAARRSVDCGFDLIELHLAHGYLLHSFLSPYSNRRTDCYGGTLENRMRFPLEILNIIQRETKGKIAIIARISVEEFLEGGLGFSEGKQICEILQENGVQAISVSAASYDSIEFMIQPMFVKQGVLLDFAKELKQILTIPVIVAGRLNDASLINRIIDEGWADMVAIGRGLLADEELVTKLKDGRPIRYCTACNQGCLDRIFQSLDIRCIFNPRTAFEQQRQVKKCGIPQNICIVGGGITGLELARVAAMQGHKVTLFERGEIGGRLNVMAKPKDRSSFALPIEFYKTALEDLGVSIINQDVQSVEQLKIYSPDRVYLATGSSMRMLPSRTAKAVSIERVMCDDIHEKSVAVLGGGQKGLECARYLGGLGKKVVVFEKEPCVGSGVGDTFLPRTLDELEKTGVTLICNCEIQDIDRLSEEYRDIELFVQTFGYEGNSGLIEALSELGAVAVGSAKMPMNIMSCTQAAWDAMCY